MSSSSPHGQLVLRASSVSSRFVESLAACREQSILGVYEQSLNLLCGEDVLVLAGREAGNLPTGLLVDLPTGETWKGMDLFPGRRAFVDGHYLALSPSLRIDLSPATVWTARRRLTRPFGTRKSVGEAVRQAAQSLSGAAGLGSAAAHLEELLVGHEPAVEGERYYVAGVAHLSALARAFLSTDASALVQAAAGLVGLGIGLTPSGDDVLVGFIGSLMLMSDEVASLGWILPAADEIVQLAYGRTHPVALTYLRCASRGEIGEMHERLLESLLAGDSVAASRACSQLRAFGHSSGGEIALGTLLSIGASAPSIPPGN